MKVIIAGSRDLEVKMGDISTAERLSGFKIVVVVNGCCPAGVDAAARGWAMSEAERLELFPADWKKHGRAAGPIRNRQMAEYADALIAIYRKGKLTPGTRSMISEARKRGLKIYEHVI